MFNKASTCTSYYIYLNSVDLTFVLMLEALSGGTMALPVAGRSKFHILDSSTNNFFLAILLIVIIFINFNLSFESFIEYLKLIARCSQTKPNF